MVKIFNRNNCLETGHTFKMQNVFKCVYDRRIKEAELTERVSYPVCVNKTSLSSGEKCSLGLYVQKTITKFFHIFYVKNSSLSFPVSKFLVIYEKHCKE